MLIVDGQIHLWENGMPSPPDRQEPYSAQQAIAAMDEAGVDRALIHPVLWDPDSNELAIEAVRNYPGRFAIMGWFYLDDPNGRDLDLVIGEALCDWGWVGPCPAERTYRHPNTGVRK